MTEKRILEITNNISEDMPPGATKAELVECVRFWSRQCSKEASKRASLEAQISIARVCFLPATDTELD